MDSLAAAMTTRRFFADELALPGTFIHPKRPLAFPCLNHGRHIVRNSQGAWLCAIVSGRNLIDRNFVGLAVAPPDASLGSVFHEPVWLAGPAYPGLPCLFETAAGPADTACLFIDAADKLTLFFSNPAGLWCLTADASGPDPWSRLKDAAAWSGPERLADPGAALADAAALPNGRPAIYFLRDGGLFELIPGAAPALVARHAQRPSVFIAANGARHVAFERDRRVFYTCSADGAAWTDSRGGAAPEMVAHFCSSWPSIAVAPNGAVVIVYQGEGKADLKAQRETYDRVRGAGGCTVSYAVLRDSAWTIRDFLRSSEILLSRRSGSNLSGSQGVFKSFMEEFWRPSLAVDLHGDVWMFYINSTRRHVYFARFYGERFGAHHEASGPYDCMGRSLFTQKDCRGQSAIGFMTVAANQLHFDALQAPQLRSTGRRRVVFLDNLELSHMSGVEHCLGQWTRHPTPLFGKFISGDTPDDDTNWCEVKPRDGGYELSYMGTGALRSNAMPGRAFSADGLRWEKRPPADHLAMTLDGAPFPNAFWRPIYLEDPSEPDPALRFKGLHARYTYDQAMEYRTWVVVASPDAVNWRVVPGLPPVVTGDISVGFHLIRDDQDSDPSRRYKVSMLMGSSAGRAVCVFTSPDLLHWSRMIFLRENPESIMSAAAPWPTGPIALDPDAAESPWEEQVHDAILWRENGLLMFHYDAFYFDGNQHIDKALAVSRDGRHYWRILRGKPNMPHGACGEWDSGRVRTCAPFRDGDELRLYFCGMPAGSFSDPDKAAATEADASPPSPDQQKLYGELRPWRVGMARLRVDGWGFLRLDRDAGGGFFTTIPFDYDGGALTVNGSGLKPGAAAVEVLHADGAPLAGFEAARCVFSAADSVASRVTWTGAPPLPHGRYRLRFLLNCHRVRLYSFGFA